MIVINIYFYVRPRIARRYFMIRPSAKHVGLIVYGRVKRRVVRLKFARSSVQ